MTECIDWPIVIGLVLLTVVSYVLCKVVGGNR